MFKKIKNFFLLLILIIPINAFAYSDYIIPGGENIGIEIKTRGIIVVGTYELEGTTSKLKQGDIITKINNKEVNSIDELAKIISSASNQVKVTYKRDGFESSIDLAIVEENGIKKTGLYIKDSITGIGTLSYIDPENNIYGALGHEIIESNTGKMLEVKDGKIVSSEVTDIDRSSNGAPGSKNAVINYGEKQGTIEENTPSGIFGKYTDILPNKEKLKVGSPNEVELGEAKMLTVINKEDVKEYKINIIKINQNVKNNKNILFEVTDEKLLEETGGIVQGMSGSPIIQNNKIIGAVTHVVVDDPKKGYGIFITNMLEEGEN